jgi:hypothetical protein
MALEQTQDKVGVKKQTARPDVARTGRDSFLKKSGSVGLSRTVDSPMDGRSGRASGEGAVHPAKGIGRGGAGKGSSAGPKRVNDGVDKPFDRP